MVALALTLCAVQIATAWAAPGGSSGAPTSRPTNRATISQKTDGDALYIIIGCVVIAVIAVTLTVFWCIRACSRAEAERARSARKEFEKGHSSGSGSVGGEFGLEDGVYSFSFEKGAPDQAEDAGISGLFVEVDVENEGNGSSCSSITRRNIEMHNRALLSGALLSEGMKSPPLSPPLEEPQPEVWRPVFSEKFKCQGWQSDVTKALVFKMPTTGIILQAGPAPESTPVIGSRRKSVRRSIERQTGDD